MKRRPRAAQKPGRPKKRASRSPRAGGDTKEALLDAAERLFAENGIQAVSLRTINTAAGARNASAAHYHFRSRESLVRAVARRRMEKLTAERLEGLLRAERDAAGGAPDLHAIIAAVTVPTFQMLLDDDGGGAHYVRFLARAATDPTVRFADLATDSFNRVFLTTLAMLQRALPEVPVAVLNERMMFGFDIGVLAPLRIDRMARRADGSLDRRAVERFAATLVDYVAGALSAPVSTTRLTLGREPPALRLSGRSRRVAGGRDFIGLN